MAVVVDVAGGLVMLLDRLDGRLFMKRQGAEGVVAGHIARPVKLPQTIDARLFIPRPVVAVVIVVFVGNDFQFLRVRSGDDGQVRRLQGSVLHLQRLGCAKRIFGMKWGKMKLAISLPFLSGLPGCWAKEDAKRKNRMLLE